MEDSISRSVVTSARSFVRAKLESDPSDLGMEFFVAFVREGLAIAIAQLPAAITLSDTVEIGVYAYDPSHIIVAFDACHALTEINPISGAPWEAGEPDDVRVHHDGVAKGWVQEAAMVSIFDRNGNQAHLLESYRSTASGHEWVDQGEPSPMRSGPHSYLSTIASRQSAPLEMRDPGNKFEPSPDAPFYPPEKARTVIDVGATRILDSRLMSNGNGSMRFIAYSPEQADLLESEGLSFWQVFHSYARMP